MKIQVGKYNDDLSQLFEAHPEYINREMVYPLAVDEKPVYLNKKYVNNKQMRELIDQHLVSIITPSTMSALVAQKKDQLVRTLSSSYENGRVLEAEKKIMIDGEEYTLVIKGMGSTRYARDTGALSPLIPWKKGTVHTPEEKEKLNAFPFLRRSGVLSKKSAMDEVKWCERLGKAGISVSKPLAIFAIKELMGPDGEYVSVEKLQEQGIIDPELTDPVILMRANLTNLRIMDVLMLEHYKKNKSLRPMLQAMAEKAGPKWGVRTIQEYCLELISRIMHQKISYLMCSSNVNGTKREDMARNISLLAEEIDVGMSKEHTKYDLDNPYQFREGFNSVLLDMYRIVREFIDVLNENKILFNQQKLADALYNGVFEGIKASRPILEKLYTEHERNLQRGLVKTFEEFMMMFTRRCFSFSLERAHPAKYEELLYERLADELSLYTDDGRYIFS